MTFISSFASFVWEFINVNLFTWLGTLAVLFAMFLGAQQLIPKPRSK